MKFIKHLILVLTLAPLASCGFHPRAQNTLRAQLYPMKITTPAPYSDFQVALRRRFAALHADLTKNRHHAKTVLNIEQTHFSHNTPTLGPTNQARVYTLSYSMTYSFNHTRAHHKQPHKTITAYQTLVLSANQTIDTNNELHTIKKELIERSIDQLINQLNHHHAHLS